MFQEGFWHFLQSTDLGPNFISTVLCHWSIFDHSEVLPGGAQLVYLSLFFPKSPIIHWVWFQSIYCGSTAAASSSTLLLYFFFLIFYSITITLLSWKNQNLLSVRLHKNFFFWESQFRNFVQEQELWDFNPEGLAKWNIKNARAISWILNSDEPSIAFNLRPYQTVADMWNYFQWVYHQENDAHQFQLEYEITQYNKINK